MRTELRLSPLLFCLALASACFNAPPEFTKDQARALSGVTEDGEDICALEGWYDDGICDDFCPEADADCVACFAIPTCDAHETAHDTAAECPADASCREVTLCDHTIWCSDTGVNCLAYPGCAPGETLYEREEDCPSEGACYPNSICGSTVWCHSDVNCAAVPSCAEGELSYNSLEECGGGAECRAETLCGSTIWCAPTATCLAFPVCEADETTHETEADCPADTSCRPSTICGSTIWCASSGCPGPNPQGCVADGCDPGFHCDTTMGDAPSACGCSDSGWVCTADLGGGVCVAD